MHTGDTKIQDKEDTVEDEWRYDGPAILDVWGSGKMAMLFGPFPMSYPDVGHWEVTLHLKSKIDESETPS